MVGMNTGAQTTKGVFDPEEGLQPKTPVVENIPKETFITPGAAKGVSQEKSIEKAMSAMNTVQSGGSATEVTSEEDAIAAITDEEEALAESMLFKGYAETNVVIPMFAKKGTYVTVCTSTPQEITFVNEIVYDYIRSKTSNDNTVEIADIELTTLKNAYLLSLGYIGINGTDFCSEKVISQANSIKMGIKKMNEYFSLGEIESGEKIKLELTNAINFRIQILKQVPTPVLDFVTEAKFEFEQRMYEIMQGDAIIPK